MIAVFRPCTGQRADNFGDSRRANSGGIFFAMLLPVIACGAMLVALSYRQVELAFDLAGASLVLLLVIGMRNAWDMANFRITRDPAG